MGRPSTTLHIQRSEPFDEHTSSGSLFSTASAAWPLSHLLMLITGVFMLKVKVLRGYGYAAPPFELDLRFGGLYSDLRLSPIACN
jgi:hypothetical protein